jgi:hypothetical protein
VGGALDPSRLPCLSVWMGLYPDGG